METGHYATNTLVVENITSINYRLFLLAVDPKRTPGETPQSFEKVARDAGHTVLYDNRRRALWHFQPVYKEDPNALATELDIPSLESLNHPGFTLTLFGTGNYEPGALAKNRPPPGTTPGAAHHQSQKQQQIQQIQDPNTGRPLEQNCFKISVLEAHSVFITSLQATFITGFVWKIGAIPLNDRTLLIPSDKSSIYDSQARSAATAAIQVSLTSAGFLMVSISVRVHEGLRLLDKALANNHAMVESSVVLAPFGYPARFRSPDSGFDNMTQTPYTPAFRQADVKTQKWRQMISMLLRVRGVPQSMIDSGPWVDVHMGPSELPDAKGHGRGSLMMHWPLKLCIRRRVVCYNPRGWEEGDYDALMSAKTWLLQAGTRAEQAARRKSERESAVAGADAESKLTQQGPQRQATLPFQHQAPNIGSQSQPALGQPLTLMGQQQSYSQRPGGSAQSPVNSGLMRGGNAMYPTPPDGVQVPQIGSLALNGEDPLSSPVTAMAGMSTIVTTHGIPDQWPPSAGSTSSLFDPNGLGSDSMLGLDHSLGHNDLTDADLGLFDKAADTSVSSPATGSNLAGQMQPPPLPNQMANQPLQVQNAVDPLTLAMPPPSNIRLIKRQDPDSDPPIFTKPELRHARSMGDNLHQSAARSRIRAVSMSQNSNRLKRGASPFGPDAVYKRLRAVVPQTAIPLHPAKLRKGSVFDKVSFDNAVPAVNSKYAEGGIFSVDSALNKRSVSETAAPLSTGYLKTHGKHRRQSKSHLYSAPTVLIYPPSHTNSLGPYSSVGFGGKDLELGSIMASPTKLLGEDGDYQSDADDVSDISDNGEAIVSGDDGMSPIKSAVMRRPGDESSARGTPAREPEEGEPNTPMEPGSWSRPPSPGWMVSKFLAEPEPLPLFPQLSGESLVAIGQLVTEQTATGFLKIYTDAHPASGPMPVQDIRRHSALLARRAVQTLGKVFPKVFRAPSQMSLRSLIDTPDLTWIQQAQQAQAQATAQANAQQQQRSMRQAPIRDQEKPPMIFNIMPSHLEMRRAETRLSVLPTAITFWESLGLGPFRGAKDIKSMCVFPNIAGLADDVCWFLDRMKIVYESLKLGFMDKVTANPGIEEGLVSYELDRGMAGNCYPSISPALAERSSAMCDAMESTTEVNKNFVIFFVYWPSNPATIVEACHAFYQLSEAYHNSPKHDGSNELVLQLVPIDLISAPSSIVIPSPQDLSRLCIETYDRCTIFDAPMPAPAIVLDEPIQRSSIEFKLSAPSQSILHENSSIHVAYAKSLDNRWISVAWTDSRGLQQQTASYCLSRKGARGPSIQWSDVANDIWQATIGLMAVWKVRWRVVISKCGPMDPSEAEFWAQLAQTETRASLYVVLLAVDSAPALQLLPHSVQLNSAMQTAASYATPVGTPQASTPSELGATPRGLDGPTPQPATTPTPSGAASSDAAADPDGDGVLVDVAEQTWGVVLSHRLNNSTVPARQNLAIASGYLVKRGGSRCEDPPAVLEINLVWVDGVARGVDPMLREMLKQFRGLGTLARARGVTEQWDVRPWHVAAAEKSVRTLYALL